MTKSSFAEDFQEILWSAVEWIDVVVMGWVKFNTLNLHDLDMGKRKRRSQQAKTQRAAGQGCFGSAFTDAPELQSSLRPSRCLACSVAPNVVIRMTNTLIYRNQGTSGPLRVHNPDLKPNFIENLEFRQSVEIDRKLLLIRVDSDGFRENWTFFPSPIRLTNFCTPRGRF